MNNLYLLSPRWMAVFVLVSCVSYAKESKVEPWFQTKECQELTIKKYKSISEHQVTASILIKDQPSIQKLIARIESLDPNGDEMISFGPKAESIDLTFQCKDKSQTIEIYQKKFKTPSTGFSSSKSEVESKLYQDIDGLLLPDFGKSILKVPNLVIHFKTFSVTFIETKESPKAEATVSFSKDVFLLSDGKGQTKTVEVTSGQTPPAPLEDKMGGTKFQLITYQTKDGQRLYPTHFQILKKGWW